MKEETKKELAILIKAAREFKGNGADHDAIKNAANHIHLELDRLQSLEKQNLEEVK